MTDIAFRPAGELTAAIRNREVSSRELLDHLLERVERLNPRINAVITLDVERARERADAADAALARGESWGPLHGLPITVKDCFETAGLRTTCGAPQLADHVPERNASAVERLLAAGAVLFGKTNTPTFTMDWQTYNPLHGTTRNPWNTDRTAGGSSGGSAAAVAAGLAGLELGSDIGGSIRIPAHCCGVYGHKPSWGIVPERGHIPGLPGSLVEDDINVVGPLARDASDLDLALSVIAGPLPEKAAAWRLELPEPRRDALRDYRVAAWFEDPAGPVDRAVRDRLQAAVEALVKAGVRVDERRRPPIDLARAVELYRRLLAPITAATLSEEQFDALVGAGQAAAAGDPGEIAAFARAVGMRHREWLAAHQEREQMRAGWADFFREVDVLLCPVAPLPAIPHDHREPLILRTLEVNGETRPYTDHFAWTGPFGAAHLPASVAPAGRTPDGLPVGIQIVAAHLEDRTSIDVARRLADQIGGFEPPPGFGSDPRPARRRQLG